MKKPSSLGVKKAFVVHSKPFSTLLDEQKNNWDEKNSVIFHYKIFSNCEYSLYANSFYDKEIYFRLYFQTFFKKFGYRSFYK